MKENHKFSQCYAKPAKKPRDETPLDERWYAPLSNLQSLYESRAEVIIMYTPSTSDACETHVPSVEKSIANLVLRLC
jgi:hypothetical protein